MVKKALKKIGGSGMFFSLLFAAAVLPVVLMGVMDPDGLRFISRADEPKEMRIWLEPAEVVTRPGVKFKLAVMGSFDSETVLIPEFQATIKHDVEVEVRPKEISYTDPFKGKVKLGEIEVRSMKEGNFRLGIDSGSVFVSLPDITAVSAGTLIVSRK